MHNDGMSYAAIGRTLDISDSTIRRWLDPVAQATANDVAVKWRSLHKEKIKAYNSTYRAAHKEETKAYQTAYRSAHREEARATGIAYYAAHKAESAAYRAEHKEEIRVYRAAWKRKHRDKDGAYIAKRRALKQGSMVGITLSQLAEIVEIYRRAKEDPKVRCYLCGNLIPMGHRHVDHIYPSSKGGAFRPSNLAVACDRCNLKKNAKLPNEVGVLI